MHFDPLGIYHIYNRGNNRQKIFFNDANYIYFLKKVRAQIKPICEILCWCLMPNHFHFMIQANKESCTKRNSFGGKPMDELSFKIGKLLSMYTQAINKQNTTTGSLFQQKTKLKSITAGETILANPGKNTHYLITCMHYIHQNPLTAKLVEKMEDWPYSSFQDYAGLRKGTLCNQDLLLNLTGFDKGNFYKDSYGEISEIDVKVLLE